MTENQGESQQIDAGQIEDAQVDVGAQAPEEGGNDRQPQTEQNPPGPLEGDEKPAPTEDEDASSEEQRTDASGRVLNPWETSPKGDSQE